MKILTDIGGPTILIFVGGLISAIGAVWAAFDQNKMSSRLEQKNEEIITLNKSLHESVTGGDSYCYLQLSNSDDPMFLINHVGKHPIYDVSARIVDLDTFEQLKSRSIREVLDCGTNISIGNIPPNSSKLLDGLLINQVHSLRLNILFSARNGFFSQLLRAKKNSSGRWVTAIRVTHNPTGTLLKQEISNEYIPHEGDDVAGWK